MFNSSSIHYSLRMFSDPMCTSPVIPQSLCSTHVYPLLPNLHSHPPYSQVHTFFRGAPSVYFPQSLFSMLYLFRSPLLLFSNSTDISPIKMFIRCLKESKSKGFGSFNRPCNLTQIGFIFYYYMYDLEIRWMNCKKKYGISSMLC